MLLAIDPVDCECGAEMRLVENGTKKTIPLVGSTVAFREYECPDCGATHRYKLDVNGNEWIHA